jgi:hypothetical protein
VAEIVARTILILRQGASIFGAKTRRFDQMSSPGQALKMP